MLRNLILRFWCAGQGRAATTTVLAHPGYLDELPAGHVADRAGVRDATLDGGFQVFCRALDHIAINLCIGKDEICRDGIKILFIFFRKVLISNEIMYFRGVTVF